MEYINLTITQLGEAPYRRSTMDERGVWLTLLGYCVQQENGGRIPEAAGWNEWECLQVLGISRASLDGKHHLWEFDDNDIVVAFYPLDKQKEVQAKRRSGKRGGLSSASSSATSSAASSPVSTHSSSAESSASMTPSTEGEGEGEGEGERKEKGKGNTRLKRGGDISLNLSEQPEPIQQRMLTINRCKRRQATTRWSAKEFAAFQAAGLEQLSPEDFEAQTAPVVAYYEAEVAELRAHWGTKDGPRRDADFRRRDLLTLLNNWAGEVDKAIAWCDSVAKHMNERESGRL